MNKKEKDKVKERLEYYTEKKFPFTKKQYREEEIVDASSGYGNLKEVVVKEIFGIGFVKKIYRYFINLPKKDNSVGF